MKLPDPNPPPPDVQLMALTTNEIRRLRGRAPYGDTFGSQPQVEKQLVRDRWGNIVGVSSAPETKHTTPERTYISTCARCHRTSHQCKERNTINRGSYMLCPQCYHKPLRGPCLAERKIIKFLALIWYYAGWGF